MKAAQLLILVPAITAAAVASEKRDANALATVETNIALRNEVLARQFQAAPTWDKIEEALRDGFKNGVDITQTQIEAAIQLFGSFLTGKPDFPAALTLAALPAQKIALVVKTITDTLTAAFGEVPLFGNLLTLFKQLVDVLAGVAGVGNGLESGADSAAKVASSLPVVGSLASLD